MPNLEDIARALRSRPTDPDTSEGVLARIIESVDGSTTLPNKSSPDFLCGLEFDNLGAEYRFMRNHDLDVATVEQHIVLRPGQAMIFDNLTCAHGRSGVRDVGELHQRCFGQRDLAPHEQDEVLRLVLARLTADVEVTPSPIARSGRWSAPVQAQQA